MLLSLLVGCVSQTEFNKQNSTQENYNKDSYECERDTRESGFYDGVIGIRDMDVFFRKCMATKGWESTLPFSSQ
jgi:hypothetical protein